jgi:hypothetical protein
MEESSQKPIQNGDIHSHNLHHESLQSNETSNNRLPSPDDDSSRMSFSSTSSKESSAIINSDRNGSILHSSLSEPSKEDNGLVTIILYILFFL